MRLGGLPICPSGVHDATKGKCRNNRQRWECAAPCRL